MFVARAAVFVASIGLGLACACGSAPSSRPGPEATPERSCAEVLARYRAVLAAASGTCAADADCGVYGGLDPDDVCGGSTDRATADALTALGAEADAAGCPRPGYSCPSIANRCVDGTCR